MKISGNWTPHTLLAGLQNAAATLESSLAVPQNVKYKVSMWARNSTPRYIPKRNENGFYTKIYTQMFTSVLCLIARSGTP